MKTRCEASSAGCSAFSASRASATSGRSRSAACRTFFKRDLVAVVEAPHRADGDRELLLAAKPVANLLQRQIGLLRYQIEQPLLVCVERRAAVPGAGFRRDAACSGPPIEPTHRRRGCKVEHPRRLPPALPLLDHRNCALAQVLGVPLRHGIPPPPLTELLEPDLRDRRNPPWPIRFTSSRNRSSARCKSRHRAIRARPNSKRGRIMYAQTVGGQTHRRGPMVKILLIAIIALP